MYVIKSVHLYGTDIRTNVYSKVTCNNWALELIPRSILVPLFVAVRAHPKAQAPVVQTTGNIAVLGVHRVLKMELFRYIAVQ